MFIYRDPGSEGATLIPQASHAWLAWQVAEHWGNRRISRPAPRAEVLAAVLLHDSGWTEFDRDPGLDPDGRPPAFDSMPVADHLAIWRESVNRAALHSRYAGLLVAAHFRRLAAFKSVDSGAPERAGGRLVGEFCEAMAALEEGWVVALSDDPRAAPFVKPVPLRANQLLLAFCDRLSVHLCAGLAGDFSLPVAAADGSDTVVRVTPLGGGRWRLSPWPLEGAELRVHCEARRPGSTTFEDRETLRSALERAPVERLSFTLLRPSRAGRGG